MPEFDQANIEKELGFPCDLMAAQKLIYLRKETLPENRDASWFHMVEQTLPKAFLLLLANEPIPGPDGFYYFAASLLPEEDLPAGEKVVPISVMGLMEDCLANCIGVVIFNGPDKTGEQPFYVISYGQIASLKSYGSLSGDPADIDEVASQPEKFQGTGQETVQEARETLIGAPSEEFLPAQTRKLMGEILEKIYELPNVGIALMVDMAHAPSRHLVLSLRQEDFKDEGHLNATLTHIQWMLPPYRPIVLNFGLEPGNFVPLK